MSFGIGQEVNEELVNQQGVYGNVSNKYIITPTQDIITELNKYHGFKPVGYSEARVRKQEKHNYQKHMVMLEAEDSQMFDGKLRIVLFNSNDRSTSIRMYLGYYRDACANDCVFGDDLMKPIMIKHTNQSWRDSVATLASGYLEAKEKTEAMIDSMLNKRLSYGDIYRLTERVSENIWKGSGKILDHTQLNNAYREEDVGKDLWHTYQRLQGNLLKGGVDRVITHVDDAGKIMKAISKTHKVTDVSEQIRLNKILHETCLQVA